jgi:hypothetical protein
MQQLETPTTMHCYKTIYYKRYTKYKYTLFITTLPYWITQKYEITLTVKCSKMENETVCKFRSKTKRTTQQVWIERYMYFEHYKNVSRQRKSE